MATLNKIVDNKKRQQIARNLQVHAWYLSTINSGVIFDHNLYTLKVQRGLYSPGPAEKPTAGSVNSLAMEGRSVIYELVNKGSGQVETSKTYDLAVYLKDFIPFDKLILDYDTYDPSGVLSASIIINTPVIPETYLNIKWDNKVETLNNNKVIASDLIEVFQQPGGAIDTRKPPVGGASANGISGVLPADGVVQALNTNPNSLPKQNVIDALAVAVRSLGPGHQAFITLNGGLARRASGTINHILGDAADFQLKVNGTYVYPSRENRELYRKLLFILRDNANAKGIRPGIGGYDNAEDGQFIHYDEAPHRQNKSGRVGYWSYGFDTSFLA
jgi:hypothetical protein